MNKPQFLDLEKIREEVIKEIGYRASDNRVAEIILETIDITIDKFQQHLKSTCKLWLNEFEELQRKWQIKIIDEYDVYTPRDLYIEHFQKDVVKLFHLVFKGMIE